MLCRMLIRFFVCLQRIIVIAHHINLLYLAVLIQEVKYFVYGYLSGLLHGETVNARTY